LKKVTVLITGGTGFIGSNLVEKCKKKGWDIISLSLNKKNKSKGIRGINLNVSNKKVLFKKLNKFKIDYIINLAGHINHYEKKKTFETHFRGCKNLIDLAVEKKIKKFIQIGSSVEYGLSKSPISENKKTNIKKLKSIYGVSKLKASNYLVKISKDKDLKYIILRPFLVYGPGQTADRLIPNTIVNCLNNENFSCSDGKQTRDFLYINDFINLVIKCIENKNVYNRILNAGSGKPTKVKKIINIIQKLIKKGNPLFGKILLRKDEPLRLYPDLKNTYKYLKWRPKKLLLNGLIETIEYYKKLN
jgi:nucleoside-diphosphate-sugar epimerase